MKIDFLLLAIFACQFVYSECANDEREMVQLNDLMAPGSGTDNGQTLAHIRDAAEGGDEEAQISLAAAYEKGMGTRQNLVEAVRWYRKAAERGNAVAQCKMGVFYGSGFGVEVHRRRWRFAN